MATGIFTSASVETPLQLLFTYGIITGRDRRILHEGYAPLNYAMGIFGTQTYVQNIYSFCRNILNDYRFIVTIVAIFNREFSKQNNVAGIGLARIFDWGGPKPQITCNDVIRNF